MYASNWNTMQSFGAQALKDMDRSRQARGHMFERAGYGPQQTPSTILHAEPGLNVRRYGPGQGDGPGRAARAGADQARLHLGPDARDQRGAPLARARLPGLPWPMGAAGRGRHADFGLADYADRLLGVAARGGRGRQRRSRAASSPAIRWAASWPRSTPACTRTRLRATVLLESPLHFEPAHVLLQPAGAGHAGRAPDRRTLPPRARRVPEHDERAGRAASLPVGAHDGPLAVAGRSAGAGHPHAGGALDPRRIPPARQAVHRHRRIAVPPRPVHAGRAVDRRAHGRAATTCARRWSASTTRAAR